MKKSLFGFLLAAVLSLSVGAASVSSSGCPAYSPTVCITNIAPNPISANTPTVVTVEAMVTDPTFIPGSLNLLKVDGVTGKTKALLGTFNDNGSNGDAVAGDGIRTVQVTFNESSDVYLRASAAMRGKIRRVLSSVEVLTVQ